MQVSYHLENVWQIGKLFLKVVDVGLPVLVLGGGGYNIPNTAR